MCGDAFDLHEIQIYLKGSWIKRNCLFPRLVNAKNTTRAYGNSSNVFVFVFFLKILILEEVGKLVSWNKMTQLNSRIETCDIGLKYTGSPK